MRRRHVFNSNVSIVIEDVQLNFCTQKAFATARLDGKGGLEGEGVAEPFVMQVDSDLRMWYVGEGSSKIGMAISPP